MQSSLVEIVSVSHAPCDVGLQIQDQSLRFFVRRRGYGDPRLGTMTAQEDRALGVVLAAMRPRLGRLRHRAKESRTPFRSVTSVERMPIGDVETAARVVADHARRLLRAVRELEKSRVLSR